MLQRRRRRSSYGGLDSAVSFSARLIAAARAREAELGDAALFTDPLAEHFAGEQALAQARSRTRNDGRIAVRTAFFDTALQAALEAAPGAQVVLLGAGLDSRAWRCSPPPGAPLAAHVFELDRSDVLAAKAELLQSAPGGPPPLRLCKRYSPVVSDVTDPAWSAALALAGHDALLPTVWLLEGLLYYLPADAVPSLLQACAAASAPGSVLVASCVNSGALARAKQSQSPAMRSFQSAIDAPAAFFAASGWRTQVVARPGDAECSFGGRHPPPPPVASLENLRSAAAFYVRAALAV